MFARDDQSPEDMKIKRELSRVGVTVYLKSGIKDGDSLMC